jgi:hypothetical protein
VGILNDISPLWKIRTIIKVSNPLDLKVKTLIINGGVLNTKWETHKRKFTYLCNIFQDGDILKVHILFKII